MIKGKNFILYYGDEEIPSTESDFILDPLRNKKQDDKRLKSLFKEKGLDKDVYEFLEQRYLAKRKYNLNR